MRLFPSKEENYQDSSLKNISLRQKIIYGDVEAPGPEKISTAKAVLLGNELIRYWKIHILIMGILYVIWALCGIQNRDFEFVITSTQYKELWAKVVCTQALIWMHSCNLISTIIALIILKKRHIEVMGRGKPDETLSRCCKTLLLVIFCSLSYYSIGACYHEHSDAATLHFCPVILFIVLSHLSCLLFKYDFSRKIKVLRSLVQNPEDLAKNYVAAVQENLESLETA